MPRTITATVPLTAIRRRSKKYTRLFRKCQKWLVFYKPKQHRFPELRLRLFALLVKNAPNPFYDEMAAHIALYTALLCRIQVRLLPSHTPGGHSLQVLFFLQARLIQQITYRWWLQENEATIAATFEFPAETTDAVSAAPSNQPVHAAAPADAFFPPIPQTTPFLSFF